MITKKTGSYADIHGNIGKLSSGDHNRLTNRDAENQHPISAITGLQEELDEKFPASSATLIEITANEAKSTAETAKTTAEESKTIATEAKTTAEQVYDIAKSAELKADNAVYVANEAKSTAASVKTIAENAQSTASDAKSYAINANTKATEAKTTAETAKTTAEAAQTAAITADTKAETAKTTAETAQTKAEAVEVIATDAKSKAEIADTKAETANTKAETADTKATTAQTTADEALAKATKVEANPTLSGEEEKLTGIKIEDTSYKIDSATWGNIYGDLTLQTDLQTVLNTKQETLVNHETIKTINNVSILGEGNIETREILPTSANAGEALVYNGESWSLQDSYGYTEPGVGTIITWDGNVANRDYIDISEAANGARVTYYKVSDLTPSTSDLLNAAAIRPLLKSETNRTYNNVSRITYVKTFADFAAEHGATISSGDGTKLIIVSIGEDETPCAYVALEAQSITVGTATLTVPSVGVYMASTEEPSNVAWNFANTLVYGNQTYWDGDITGKTVLEVFGITFYKINDKTVTSIDALANVSCAEYVVDGESSYEESYLLTSSEEILTLTKALTDFGATNISGADNIILLQDSNYYNFAMINNTDTTVSFTYNGTTYSFSGTAGTYLRRNYTDETDYSYVCWLNYLVTSYVHEFDSKYIPVAEIPKLIVTEDQIESQASSEVKVNLTDEQIELLCNSDYAIYFFTMEDGSLSSYVKKSYTQLYSANSDYDLIFESVYGFSSQVFNLVMSINIADKLLTAKEIELATKSDVNAKSTVEVSATGTATDEIKYITVDGTEKKIAQKEYTAGDGINITDNVISAAVDNSTIQINADKKLEAIKQPDLFWCTYDTTTYEEITNARNLGKLPVCFYKERLYTFGGIYEDMYFFSNIYKSATKDLTCANTTENAWNSSSTNLQTKLKATDGSITLNSNDISVTNPIPAYTAADAGKVLAVKADGSGLEWRTI